MIKVKEKVNDNVISFKGNMPDILAYLEKEQERCGKISVSKYIRLRRIERDISKPILGVYGNGK